MKGKKWDNFKSAAMSVLLGVLVAIGLPWVNRVGQFFAGYVVAQFTWVLFVAIDEVQRQRDERRKRRY